MFTKSFTSKEIRAMMDDKFQNLMVFQFILKYLYECHKRNKRLIKETNKTTPES